MEAVLHAFLLHFCFTCALPRQGLPPFGAGLEQVLVFVLKPPPHDLLHFENFDHLLQRPLTKTKIEHIFYVHIFFYIGQEEFA